MKDFGNKEAMAKNLRYFMLQKGVAPKEVSRAIGIPYTTVRSWLNGDNYPRIDKIELLAEYFGVMKSDLIEEANRSIISEEADKKTTTIARLALKMRTDESLLRMADKLSKLTDAQRAIIEPLLSQFVPDE